MRPGEGEELMCVAKPPEHGRVPLHHPAQHRDADLPRVRDPRRGEAGREGRGLWEAARREAESCAHREAVRLIAAHIACNQSLESTGWVACDPTESAFFRLTRPAEGRPPRPTW